MIECLASIYKAMLLVPRTSIFSTLWSQEDHPCLYIEYNTSLAIRDHPKRKKKELLREEHRASCLTSMNSHMTLRIMICCAKVYHNFSYRICLFTVYCISGMSKFRSQIASCMEVCMLDAIGEGLQGAEQKQSGGQKREVSERKCHLQ